MILIKQRIALTFVLINFLLTKSVIFINATAGRCYLCSQNTLAECVGSIEPNSLLYGVALQYYTEPCNGQCVLFRNRYSSTIRGCSWTYGHMVPKPTGWHELSPGIEAYFCDSYLCNNGTYEQPEPIIMQPEIANTDSALPFQQTINPQELFLMGGSIPQITQLPNQQFPLMENVVSHQLRQCYSCTARSDGCGEFLDPRFVVNYIRPCTSSCIIFRNPNDHNVITRDCATDWPQVHAKSGLHKLLGSDAFFCQESLCNGIGFDFIMGIFHNQAPAVVTFSPTFSIEESSVESTTVPAGIIIDTSTTPIIDSETTTTSFSNEEDINADIDVDVDNSDNNLNPDISTINDNHIEIDEPDLDLLIMESTTVPTISDTSTTLIPVTVAPVTEFSDDFNFVFETTSLPIEPIEHFDFFENIPPSSTISGGVAIAQQDSEFNWWDADDASFQPIFQPTSTLITTTVSPSIQSTSKQTSSQDNDWLMFNTTLIPFSMQTESLSDSNFETDMDVNDYFLMPTLTTTTTIIMTTTVDIDLDKNNTLHPVLPYDFTNHKTKDELSELIESPATFAIPPFTWMLELAQQDILERQRNQSNSTNNKKKTKTKAKNKSTTVEPNMVKHTNLDQFYDLCNKKQCQNGGRLASNCQCICLPAFAGENCEIVYCDQEPAHICESVLEHECKSDYVRHLCPKFCQINICSSKKST